MNQLPAIGERIVVYGMPQKATVEDIIWDEKNCDWKINLDWSEFGKSRVWAHDEHKVWYRWVSNN